jgi:hypothetical protein
LPPRRRSFLRPDHARDLTSATPTTGSTFNLEAAELRAQGFEIHVGDDFHRLAPSGLGCGFESSASVLRTGSESKSMGAARSCADAGRVGLGAGFTPDLIKELVETAILCRCRRSPCFIGCRSILPLVLARTACG